MRYNSVEDYVKNAENNRNPAVLNSLLESEPGMKELPEITPEDEGKILQVNNGSPSWASGGSSGSGVLVVGATLDEDEMVSTLDKTAGEIMAAGQTGIVIVKYSLGGEDMDLFHINRFSHITPIGYEFTAATGAASSITFHATSANDYPNTHDQK